MPPCSNVHRRAAARTNPAARRVPAAPDASGTRWRDVSRARMVDLLKRLLPEGGGAGGWVPAMSESAPGAVVPRLVLEEASCFLLGHCRGHQAGKPVVPIRWVLVRDPPARFEPFKKRMESSCRRAALGIRSSTASNRRGTPGCQRAWRLLPAAPEAARRSGGARSPWSGRAGPSAKSPEASMSTRLLFIAAWTSLKSSNPPYDGTP